ncbi:MAG: type II secretion system minor pseudopilin GspK [Duganella sp.]
MAVVTALLLTTLAVTIVASLFWQQQVQVRSMENQRLQFQTRWIVRGSLNFSKLILFTDFYSQGGVTSANGIWSKPLEETRIDDYIEREQREEENFNATLAGQIVDAQSRYNLTNLAPGGKIDALEVAVLQRLLTNLQLDQTLAMKVASQVASAQPVVQTPDTTGTGKPTGAAQSAASIEPMGLVRVEDLLALSGFTPQAVERLREFLIILPQVAPLDVNTAPAELLAALSPNLPLADAAVLVNKRKQGYFYRDKADYTKEQQLLAANRQPAGRYDVRSSYFLVYSRVRLDRAALDAVSLLQRGSNGMSTVVWIREN